MTVVETSISVNKPVEEVFAFLSDPNNQTRLNSTLTEVVVDGPVAVGTKFKLKGSVMGRDFETDNEIVALEKNKSFGMKTFAAPPASDVTNTYTFEKEGSGTKVTLAMDSVIMTGGVPGMEDMVKNQLKSGLESTMAAIKKALEG
jgi:carbon monoxide dehydrogenase subunit G